MGLINTDNISLNLDKKLNFTSSVAIQMKINLRTIRIIVSIRPYFITRAMRARTR